MKPHLVALPVALCLHALGCGSEVPAAPADASLAPAIDAPTGADATPDVGALATDGPPVAPGDARLARGLAVQSVAVFQSVKVTLAQSGAESVPRNAPVVAGRAAVVRAYVLPAGGWVAQSVTAELVLSREGAEPTVFRDTRVVTRASRDEDLASIFAFAVPADQIAEGTSYRVQLQSVDGAPVALGEPSDARFPPDGSTAALGAQSDLGGLDLVLVPFRYDTDGSGRMPDTSPAQLARVRALLTALYPIAQVNITVRPVQPWTRPLTTSGNVDFTTMNEALVRQRGTDRAPSAAYYYGLVSPAISRTVYCGRSCTTGQSFVVRSAGNGSMRVGAGVGFEGEASVQTLAHEIGHQHGRSHAPCNTSNPDADYPYRTGSIGVWGYDSRIRGFVPPSRYSDFMSYCEPEWVSDYTYSGLFDRVRAVRAMADRRGDVATAWRFVHLDGAQARWGARVTLVEPADEDSRDVRWLGAGDTVLRREAVPRFSRGDEGAETLLVPDPPRGAVSVEIQRDSGPWMSLEL